MKMWEGKRRTYRVKRGEFEGKIVWSFDDKEYVLGINSPWIYCFDDYGKEYIIFFNDLENYPS